MRARLVLEQRVQSLACVPCPSRGASSASRETGEPLRMASSEEAAAVLRQRLLKLAVFAQRCTDLKLREALRSAYVPENATRRTCRDAMLACRTALLAYANDAPPPPIVEEKKTKRQKVEDDPGLRLRQSALCAADALLLAAHTHTFVKVSRRGTATAPGVEVIRDDVGKFPCKSCDTKAPCIVMLCVLNRRTFGVQERTYGPWPRSKL